jgi:hypothetical protein
VTIANSLLNHVTHSHRHCKASVPLKSFQVILTVRQDVFSPFVHTTSSLSVMGCIEPWEFDTSHLRPPVPRKTTHLRAIYSIRRHNVRGYHPLWHGIPTNFRYANHLNAPPPQWSCCNTKPSVRAMPASVALTNGIAVALFSSA